MNFICLYLIVRNIWIIKYKFLIKKLIKKNKKIQKYFKNNRKIFNEK